MSGYVWRGAQPKPPQPMDAVQAFRTLTRQEWAALPDTVRERRRRHWLSLVSGLQLDHVRRYHSSANVAELNADIRRRSA